MRTPGALILVAAALLAPAATADARNCDSRAKLTSGKVERTSDRRLLEAGATLRRDQTYAARRVSKVRFQHATYKLHRGSEFSLGCYGHTAEQGTPFPRLELYRGHVKMITTRRHAAAVSTSEAISDAYRNRALRIVFERRRKSPTSRFGRTKIDKVHGRGKVNVVPYVGRRPGQPRHVDGATLTSKRIEGGYLKGTATYRR